MSATRNERRLMFSALMVRSPLDGSRTQMPRMDQHAMDTNLSADVGPLDCAEFGSGCYGYQQLFEPYGLLIRVWTILVNPHLRASGSRAKSLVFSCKGSFGGFKVMNTRIGSNSVLVNGKSITQPRPRRTSVVHDGKTLILKIRFIKERLRHYYLLIKKEIVPRLNLQKFNCLPKRHRRLAMVSGSQAPVYKVRRILRLRLITGVSETIAIGSDLRDAANEATIRFAGLPVIGVVGADDCADVPIEVPAICVSPLASTELITVTSSYEQKMAVAA